jgi:osmotically-inducible protein OsmY
MKNDRDLVKQVQEALATDANLKNNLTHIHVFAKGSAVILSGSVDSHSSKKAARRIVLGIPGVTSVGEDLKVEPSIKYRVGVFFDWAKGSMAISN